MERLDATAAGALRAALAEQPLTEGKVLFAWTLAAGTALARAGRATWSDGILCVEPKSEAWRRELRRLRPVLIARLGALLGPNVVRQLKISAEGRK